MSPEIEALARTAVDAGFHIHSRLGPGLLESAYEAIMEDKLRRHGLNVDRQVLISESEWALIQATIWQAAQAEGSLSLPPR